MQQLCVTDAIANFIEQLPDPDKPLVLSPWTQSLVGIGMQAKNVNSDELQQEYLDYLEEKYQ